MVASPLNIDAVRLLKQDPVAALGQLEPLLATLASEEEELRAWAADALQGIEAIPEEQSPILLVALRSECVATALWACKLMERTPSTEENQRAVVRLLDSHSATSVQQQAVKSLGGMGRLSQDILAKLDKVVSSEDPRMSRLAQRAIERNAA